MKRRHFLALASLSSSYLFAIDFRETKEKAWKARKLNDAAIKLYTNPVQWNKVQLDGFEIAKNLFSPELHFPKFNELLDNLFSNLELHREKDYTSKLMQQQTMMSARYLSYWIMEKEKK